MKDLVVLVSILLLMFEILFYIAGVGGGESTAPWIGAEEATEELVSM